MRKYFLALVVLLIMLLFNSYFILKMPESSFEGTIPALNKKESQIKDNLNKHVDFLANTIGQRNVYTLNSLKQSAKYISDKLAICNTNPVSQEYLIDQLSVSNVIGTKTTSTNSKGVIVIGAHYDTILDSPGANDNATGVAAMLELCRLLSKHNFNHTIKFVGFVNEEPPFFKTNKMGSYVFAKHLKENGIHVKGMLSLETIGAYYPEPNTQQYPPLLKKIYPNQGDFVAFISNPTSSWLLKSMIKSFRQTSSFPSEGLMAPGSIQGVDWSDHWAFWQFGYPAIMVTDTALFRYPYYHTHNDTHDKVDFESLARVVNGLEKVLIKLDKEI